MEIQKTLTVSQISEYIKSIFDDNKILNNVIIEGEISNYKRHSSGHLYFSLKDSGSVISAVMFRGNAINLKFTPENGMKVVARGRISIYKAYGSYQIYVEELKEKGIGDLHQQYEELKNKLFKEGLFDDIHKKPIPVYPRNIGIITSKTGAVVRDIANVIRRRYPCVKLCLENVHVQGDLAVDELVRAINKFSNCSDIDTIIIGRGGGSLEDLWAFNSEKLAYAIYNCRIPVISAVGHETDFTICDFVSDLRAPTPSAAAECAVPSKDELLDNLSSINKYAFNILNNNFSKYKDELKRYSDIVEAHSPKLMLENNKNTISLLKNSIDLAINTKIEKASSDINYLVSQLESINPISVLSRGFSYVTKDYKNISSVKQLDIDDEINIKLSDGVANAKIIGFN